MLPAKNFYMIRHGESEANAARITAGGQFDSPLTVRGEGQARALAACISELKILPEVIYHSDMKRARRTAELLNEALNIEMHELHDLREHDLGEWDGQPWEDILPLVEAHQSPQGGESVSQFAQRIQATLTDILKKEDRRVMIVAHGGLFHAMGFLYEYGISPIQNCHLHSFVPQTDYSTFPWRVWQYDIEDSGLKRTTAPFCFSQAMERIAS